MTVTPENPLFAVAIFCVLSGAAQAGLYKCTDADSQIYFTDVGCPADTEVERLPSGYTAPMPNSGSIDLGYDPSSVAEQVRAIEQDRSQREQARTQQRAQANDRAALSRIEQEITDIEGTIRSKEQDLRKSNSPRERWTREELAELRSKRASLLRQRENILARYGVPITEATNSDNDAAAREAEARAEAAEARARHAEAEAFRRQNEPLPPVFNPSTRQWCQQTGAIINCW